MDHPLTQIPKAFGEGRHLGITSVCSAHPLVIEAALEIGRDVAMPVLIEATCNQVNQDGGYTGMTPTDFRDFVFAMADKTGFDTAQLILGGDHLGPNPWKDLPADAAMDKAEAMIAAYASAGFTKLHLDTSMGCQGEPAALADAETAARAARLAVVAEAHKRALDPVYVIGTEVPVPGGANHAITDLELTTPAAVETTYAVHRDAFRAAGASDALSRVIALVVQPGVEFGHTDVVHFDPARAARLSDTLKAHPGLVFEAHSTDYQTAEGLRDLVAGGFAILKVGPWLTFALREALYALDGAADVMDGQVPQGRLMAAMETAMQSAPKNWQAYYAGSDRDTWLQRHFSYSDRIRYYWPAPDAQKAVDDLVTRIGKRPIPAPVLHQFFPARGLQALPARQVVLEAIKDVLRIYHGAIAPGD
jgi:D-tagatose-1,6-bisphosphate aldolase subunit GatZ/KbaZ